MVMKKTCRHNIEVEESEMKIAKEIDSLNVSDLDSTV